MQRIFIPFNNTSHFTSLVDDYLSGNDKLKPYYRFTPGVDSFSECIDQRMNYPVDRLVLHEALKKQYGNMLSEGSLVSQNITSLKSNNTFTVTTGHQLNIFAGPVFFIYKIATTISLAINLKKRYPDFHFVPVYWMASEDHDFDEISSVRVMGKTVEWKPGFSGPVGRFALNGLSEVISEIKSIIGDRFRLPEIFEDAYLNSGNLAEATRKIVHDLFSDYGLVVIDGDDKQLKTLFIQEMKTEITGQLSFNTVTETNETFSKLYKAQVTPREVNLFYMKDGLRERIVLSPNGTYSIFNTDKELTKAELLGELENYPEQFSPNVITRPLYQEKILPNLASIGGPGELNYWLQLMGTFDAFQIPFPVLILRNCMLIINPVMSKKMEKVGIEVEAIFHSTDFLTLEVLESAASLHIGTDKQASVIQKVMDELVEVYTTLDPTLAATVEAEKQRMMKGLQNLEDKARRALKKKNETLVGQVKHIKEVLIPDGNLQERTDNVISLSGGDVKGFVSTVMENTDPFANKFIVLKDD